MSFNTNNPNADAQMRSNAQKRYGSSLNRAQRKWLKKVCKKWYLFLEKIKADAQAAPILQKAYKEVYQKAVAIYKNDGQSLENWLAETLNSSGPGGKIEPKDEASVATYREQFKNMLALDIWIDKLLQWQHNGYKLEMPVKEPVDPMTWNKILKAKFLRVMQEENDMHTPAPKADASSRPDIYNTDGSRSLENQRKRMHNSTMSGVDSVHDSDKYRMLKSKKLHEGYPDAKHESALSTDRTSEISLAIRHQGQKPVLRPAVSMTELFKSLSILK